MSLVLERTTYSAPGVEPFTRREHLPLHKARAYLARTLRTLRRELDVVIIRDRVEETTPDAHRRYFVTNAFGPSRFERTITVLA